MTKTLEAIRYTPDQLLLPFETVFEPISNVEQGHAAIRSMKVRGAPAIAIVAALSLAVEIEKTKFKSATEVVDFVDQKLEFLKTSRPTAVNLFEAAARLSAKVHGSFAAQTSAQDLVDLVVQFASDMLEQDVSDNKNIGKHGADFILDSAQSDQVCVLTHCNTGSLATAGYGTALGIIRDLHKRGKLERAFCTETRPYNQGARLTAYELVYENMPSTMVCDNMVSALLKTGRISAIVVGADRVAANGDTANKIGTYQMAISAHYHGVPFLVAAPITSIDLKTKSGKEIVIEERPMKEMVEISGPDVQTGVKTRVNLAAPGIEVWNPAFDVTPAHLITAIVTEKGIVQKQKDGNEFDLQSWLNS